MALVVFLFRATTAEVPATITGTVAAAA